MKEMIRKAKIDCPFAGCRLTGYLCSLLLCVSVALVGCGTTSTHTVTEQLLVSDAVDQAISKISFDDLEGETVFLDTQYVKPVKELGFANTNYILSSLRQHLLAAGCYIQDSREEANIVVEPRIGALGTEGQVVTFGIPRSNEVSTAASIFAQTPFVPAIPEISFGKSDLQSGAAKLAVFAYHRESREPVWQSGTRVAKSYSKSTWFLGAGPVRRGTIHDGVRFAGVKLPMPGNGSSKLADFDHPQIRLEDEVHYSPLDDIPVLQANPVQQVGHSETPSQSKPQSSDDNDSSDSHSPSEHQ